MGAKITHGQIFIILLALALMVGLQLFVHRTRLGKAMRATAQNRTMARVLGINTDQTIRITFMIGPALGAAAGVMVGLHYGAVRFDMGFIFMIKAFAAAILGGIGSIPGRRAGGDDHRYGIEVSCGPPFLPSAWKDVTTFTVLISGPLPQAQRACWGTAPARCGSDMAGRHGSTPNPPALGLLSAFWPSS
jgi:branched-chain amino acid transport system permease protein